MYGNLKVFRESLGMTQKEFAASLSIGLTTYNGYETGARDPKSDFWIAVAKKYGVTIDYLMGYSPEPDKTSEDIKKSPPEQGEDSAREEQLKLERNWAQPQENQLPKGTAFYSAMMAQSNMADPDILRMETGCLALLDQIVRKARFGDQYDKDTLSCAADFLSICSRGLDQSQKESSSLFSYARRLLLQTVKLIGAMVECEQKEPGFARGVLNDFQLLVSWSLYAFSVGKYEEFAKAWDKCQEVFDKYAIGPEAFEREKEVRAEAETYYRQRLSEKKQESPASSANESGAG